MESPSKPAASLTVERIEVRPDRTEVLVFIGTDTPPRTSAVPGLRERALELLPGLRRHTCENDAGRHFSAELADTETAHLLEHVTVELMALSGSPRSLRAETRWDFATDGRGRYRLSIGYDDDLVALGALKEAVRIVIWLLDEEGDAPLPAEIAARLRALRQR